MDPSEIAALIEAGLPNASVRVQTDDHTHFEAIVVAEAFDGKRPMQRHQLIYIRAQKSLLTNLTFCNSNWAPMWSEN